MYGICPLFSLIGLEWTGKQPSNDLSSFRSRSRCPLTCEDERAHCRSTFQHLPSLTYLTFLNRVHSSPVPDVCLSVFPLCLHYSGSGRIFCLPVGSSTPDSQVGNLSGSLRTRGFFLAFKHPRFSPETCIMYIARKKTEQVKLPISKERNRICPAEQNTPIFRQPEQPSPMALLHMLCLAQRITVSALLLLLLDFLPQRIRHTCTAVFLGTRLLPGQLYIFNSQPEYSD